MKKQRVECRKHHIDNYVTTVVDKRLGKCSVLVKEMSREELVDKVCSLLDTLDEFYHVLKDDAVVRLVEARERLLNLPDYQDD